MLHAVVLAGGSGTRLWPESRQSKAKQFLSFESGRSLLQSTTDRLTSLLANDSIWILTTAAMKDRIQTALPFLSVNQILAEPAPRNTAPCIGLAAAKLLKIDPDATMIVLPSDHVIRPDSVLCDTLRYAADLVEEDSSKLITLGIKPTFPSTSYGYIERNSALKTPSTEKWKHLTTAYHVARFHEKPDAKTAAEFLKTGRFAWNAGIFVWKAQTIFDLLQQFEPEIGRHLEAIFHAIGTSKEDSVVEEHFSEMKRISIDYAVLERAPSIVVLEATFSWDDVGTWCSLDRLYSDEHDKDGNLVVGARILALDSKNCVVRASDPDHLFALLGMEDIIVVQTEDATLIARKDREESVRNIIDELKKRNWNEYL